MRLRKRFCIYLTAFLLIVSFTAAFPAADEEYVENIEILSLCLIHSDDMDLYKMYSDISVNFEGTEHPARYRIRSYKYSFVSDQGKLYEIEYTRGQGKNPRKFLLFGDLFTHKKRPGDHFTFPGFLLQLFRIFI